MSNELTLFDYGVLPVNDAMALSAIKERIKIRLKRTAEDIIEIGLDLIEAKRIAGHGGFENWLKAEFEFSSKTAQKFMNVAEEFGSKNELSSFFTSSILYALSAPSMPDEVRTEIIERVESGESVDLKEIQRLKRESLEAQEKLNAIQNDLLTTKTALQNKTLSLEAFKQQNNELRDEITANVDTKVNERIASERAALILENSNAIQQAERERDNIANEFERLKREQEKAIKDGVKSELDKLDTQINQKRYAFERIERDYNELQKAKEELDAEVGAIAIHKSSINQIKSDLTSLTLKFSDAFDTNVIPDEVSGDWDAIFYAISKIKKQMSEWRDQSAPLYSSVAVIGEIVD